MKELNELYGEEIIETVSLEEEEEDCSYFWTIVICIILFFIGKSIANIDIDDPEGPGPVF